MMQRSLIVLSLLSAATLAGCAMPVPSGDRFTLEGPMQWGNNAFVFESGSIVTTVRMNRPAYLPERSPAPYGNCDFNREQQQWTCPHVDVSNDDGFAIGGITLFSGSVEANVQRIQSAGYFVAPHEMTGSFHGWVDGTRRQARVFVLGTEDAGAVLAIFVDRFQLWAYLQHPERVQQNVLDAIAFNATTDEERRAFEQFMYDQETKPSEGTDTVSVGAFHLTLPPGYSAGTPTTWTGSIMGPNGFCVLPRSKNTWAANDSAVVIVTREDSRFEWVWISTPNLCKSLLDTDRYCFQAVTKNVPFGSGTLALSTIYNNPDALDWKRQDERTGEVPCTAYEPTPAMIMWSEGCRTDDLCIYSTMKPQELETLLGAMTEE